MSYDVHAFPVPAGMSAAEYVESDAYEALDDAPPTPEEREAMARAATALQAVDPSAERLEDADFIELVTHDAIQVNVYARSAAINVPYWYEGTEADAVMERVFAYARVISETLGYTVWDPQTGTVVEPGAGGHADAAEIMGDITGRMGEIVQPQRRPWWKIWG
jgi:hypothetical protein